MDSSGRPVTHLVSRAIVDHVRGGRADVLGGDVAAAERVDDPSVGAQQPLRLDRRGVADDDGLAAAQVEAGRGRLVGHRLWTSRSTSVERFVLDRVRKEAGPAEGGTECGRVDGDDRLEARYRVVAEEHLFVGVGADCLEYPQRRVSFQSPTPVVGLPFQLGTSQSHFTSRRSLRSTDTSPL